MAPRDYRAILSAVEQAIAVCGEHTATMDAIQRKVCEDLHRVRAELLRHLNSVPHDEG